MFCLKNTCLCFHKHNWRCPESDINVLYRKLTKDKKKLQPAQRERPFGTPDTQKQREQKTGSLYCLFLEFTYLSSAYIFNRNTSEPALWPKHRSSFSIFSSRIF